MIRPVTPASDLSSLPGDVPVDLTYHGRALQPQALLQVVLHHGHLQVGGRRVQHGRGGLLVPGLYISVNWAGLLPMKTVLLIRSEERSYLTPDLLGEVRVGLQYRGDALSVD